MGNAASCDAELGSFVAPGEAITSLAASRDGTRIAVPARGGSSHEEAALAVFGARPS